jgi:hypothetical protein
VSHAELIAPVLFFLLREPPGQDLTIFSSVKTVREQMDVWVAREDDNVAFDRDGRIIRSDFRNETARSVLGGFVKVGGVEYVVGEEAPDPPDRLRRIVLAWLSARRAPTQDGAIDDLLQRCIDLGAPVRS